ADVHGISAGHHGWLRIRDLVDWVSDNWDQPEEGIWETRGGRQNFTYGRLMCWVAQDRGAGALAPGTGRDLRPDHGPRVEHHPAGLPAALRHRCPGLVAAADVVGRLHHTDRSAVDVHVDGDGRGTGDRQPGLPLRPRGVTGRPARLGGDVLVVHLRLRRLARAGRPAREGAGDVREDADLREPPGSVLG